jgi:hypothetical protein
VVLPTTCLTRHKERAGADAANAGPFVVLLVAGMACATVGVTVNVIGINICDY